MRASPIVERSETSFLKEYERGSWVRYTDAASGRDGTMADDDMEILQRFVDSLYRESRRVTRLDAVVRAEALDLPNDLVDIVQLLPPGMHTRQSLCDQLNSALKGHGWTGLYGTVD